MTSYDEAIGNRTRDLPACRAVSEPTASPRSVLVSIIIIIIIIILAKEQYIKRHDRVGAQLHYNTCKEMGVQLDTKHWYEHVPKSVETTQGEMSPYCGINQYERTELFLTINQIL